MKKRLLAVLTMLVLVFTMSITAYADTNKATLTVSGEELAGKTVTVVRIFNDNSSNEAGSTPAYTLRATWNAFFEDQLHLDSSTEDISTLAYRHVVAMQDNSEEMDKLAKAAYQYYLAQKAATPPVTFSTEQTAVANASGTATFEDLGAGMYLVFPQSGSTSATRLTDAMLVTIRNTDVDMEIKSVYPKVDKTVKPASAQTFTEDTAAAVGDYVQFKLTSTVPEMTDYSTYVFKFKDTLSTGLTFTKDNTHPMVLTIGEETLVEGTDFTFTQPEGDQSILVTINNLKALAADNTKNIDVGDAITLTYFAELNSSAVIGVVGNPNQATVVYSNNPSNASETGESTSDISKVYTYEIEIKKFSKDGQDEVVLAGAKFELYRDPDTTANRAPVQLIETATANTYRVATPQEIADNAVTKITEVRTDSTGKIMIDGLDLGTYYLKETEAPTGYNQLVNDVVVTIAADDANTQGDTEDNYASVYYTVNGTQNQNANNKEVKVENRPGSLLPTTGSVGTIGLTAAGVAIVILGIVVTSRKKKEKKGEKAE